MSRQSLICHIDLLHSNIHRDFIWTIIEIGFNPDDIINNNLIFPIFCRALIYYWIIIIYYWINNNPKPDYNNPIIIYYYYNPRINISQSCLVYS